MSDQILNSINDKIVEIRDNSNSNQIEILNQVVNNTLQQNSNISLNSEGELVPSSSNEAQENPDNLPINEEVYVTPDNLMRKIGILDPEGSDVNPFTGGPYQNLHDVEGDIGTYTEGSKIWTNLPVYNVSEKVINALNDHQVLLLTSGTGSGKTVLVPKYMSHVLDYKGRVIVSNPKRIPTLSAAEFAAKLLDVELGTYVGFKYRGSKMPGSESSKTIDRKGTKSNIIYATDGYILAKLMSDPLLEEFDAVIIDEAHERNISIDLLLMLLKFTLSARPDFKLVIMSATVNSKVFSDYYDKDFKFTHIELPSESNFPVEEFYMDKSVNKVKDGIVQDGHSKPLPYVKESVDRAVKIMLEADEDERGDILIFVAGKAEALDGCMYLSQVSKENDLNPFCIELHGRSSKDDEELAKSVSMFQNKPGAPFTLKVVIATEVAESSITLPVQYICETGLAKESRFYPETGVDALEKRYISKASHTQRRGRAGRTKPGTCYNIFTKEEYEKEFPDFSLPPILTEDVTETILEFLNSKFVSHVNIPFKYAKKYGKLNPEEQVSLDEFLSQLITPPKEEFVSFAIRQLFALGGLRQEGENKLVLTPTGEALNRFRMLPPVMAKAVLTSYDFLANSQRHRRDDVIAIAALMEVTDGSVDKLFESEPRYNRMDKDEAKEARARYNRARKKVSSKHGDMIVALETYHKLLDISHPPSRRDDMSEEEKGALTSKASKFAKENFIRYKPFKEAYKLVKKYRKDLNRIANKKKDHLYFEKHYEGEAGTFEEFINEIRSGEIELDRELLHGGRVFIDEEDHVYDNDQSNAHMNNVLLSLFSGFFVNYATKVGKNTYLNCFYKERSRAQVDRFSFVAEMKTQPKHAFYYIFKDIGGRRRLNTLTGIPETVLKKASVKNLSFLKHCMK